MKAVQVQYFAILREQRGLAEEKLETEAPTPAALYDELRARYAFTLPVERIRAAVNGDFVAVSEPLQDGDTLVFIPPVAGG
jgi:molybdopterin converting factor subunit 1